jgi:hypothetical protein
MFEIKSSVPEAGTEINKTGQGSMESEEKLRREQWENFRQKLTKKIGLLAQKAKVTFDKMPLVILWERCADFSEIIMKKYPDYNSYIAFHTLGGSSFTYEKAPNLDFSGAYSVESFFNDLEKEFDEIIEKKRLSNFSRKNK